VVIEANEHSEGKARALIVVTHTVANNSTSDLGGAHLALRPLTRVRLPRASRFSKRGHLGPQFQDSCVWSEVMGEALMPAAGMPIRRTPRRMGQPRSWWRTGGEPRR